MLGADGCLWLLQGGAAAAASSSCPSRRRAFQAWLSQQSELLSSVLSSRTSPRSPQELLVRQDTLKVMELLSHPYIHGSDTVELGEFGL